MPANATGGNATLGNSTAVRAARQFLEGFSTTEDRLFASGVLLLFALVLAVFVMPVGVDRLKRVLTSRTPSGRVASGLETAGQYVPTTLSGLLLRTVQVLLLLTTASALLVVWGLSDVVREAALVAYDSIPLIGQSLSTVLLLLAGYVGSRALGDSVANFSESTEWMTDHQEEVLLRVSQLVLFSLVGLGILFVWQIQLGSLLVGAGFLGIVIGLAARQTLGSLIAGLVLMFSRPFTIGDWVQVGDQEGIVTDITIMNTRLENFDGEFVILPNEQVSQQPITNRSRKGLLRLKVDVGIDYDADPEEAERVALEAISDLDAIVDAPPPQMFPKRFGDSAVVMEMRFWIDNPSPPRKWRAISAAIHSVKTAYEEAGIKIPYPQRELSGRAETGGFRVHGAEDGATRPVESGDGAEAEPDGRGD